jgi:hypothetical protein
MSKPKSVAAVKAVIIVLLVISGCFLTIIPTSSPVDGEFSRNRLEGIDGTSDPPLSSSEILLRAGTNWTANGGHRALFVDTYDNWIMHGNSDGVGWAWPSMYTLSGMIKEKWNVANALQRAGLSVEFSGDIPQNMSDYDTVVIFAYWACAPRDSALIRNYIENGGGVVLFAGVPEYLRCNIIGQTGGFWTPTDPLSVDNPDWLGFTGYMNSGGNAILAIDHPFGTDLMRGDLLIHTDTYSSASVTGVSGTIIAEWGLGETFACSQEFGAGRLYYQASYVGTYQSDSDLNWTTPVIVKDDEQRWNYVDFGVGINAMYILAWVYPDQSTILIKSYDGGLTWTDQITVFGPMNNANPKMCIYPDGEEDHIYVVAGNNIGGIPVDRVGHVKESLDSGKTFSGLTDIPIKFGSEYWLSMTVETNSTMASMPQDSDIYIAGYQYYFTNVFQLSFTRSTDRGMTWEEPVLIGDSIATIPQLLRSQDSLYLIYLSIDQATYGNTYIKHSSDWGKTWSGEKLLLENRGYQSAVCNVQCLNDTTALLTCVDTFHDSSLNSFHYGTLDFAAETYREVGRSASSKKFPEADYFCGRLLENGTLASVFLSSTITPGNCNVEFAESPHPGILFDQPEFESTTGEHAYISGDVVLNSIPSQSINILIDGNEQSMTNSYGHFTVAVTPGIRNISFDYQGDDYFSTQVYCADNVTTNMGLIDLGTNYSLFGNITGSAFTSFGYAVPSAFVTVDNGSPLACNEDGSFRLSLTRGHHNLTLSASGFNPVKQEVVVIRGTTDTIGQIELEVNNSAMGLSLFKHNEEFSILTPSSWSIEEDQFVSGMEMDLILNGPLTDGVTTNINIQSGFDPTVKDDTIFLWSIINETISLLAEQGIDAQIYEGPVFSTVDNFTCMVYSLQNFNYQLVQKQAFIVDVTNHRYWIITCTTSLQAYVGYRPMFDQMIASFSASETSFVDEGLIWLIIIGGVVLGGLVIVILFLMMRKSKNRDGINGPISPAPSIPQQAAYWNCINCGTINSPDGDYCHNCGARKK